MRNARWGTLGLGVAMLLVGCGDEPLLAPDRPESAFDRAAQAPVWRLVDLGVPGNSFTTAYAINDAGVIGGATASLNAALVDRLGKVSGFPMLPGYPNGQGIGLNTTGGAVCPSQPTGLPFVIPTAMLAGPTARGVSRVRPHAVT